jgi:hypothetical protein
MKPWTLAVVLTLVLGLTTGAAWAADPPMPQLTVDKVDAAAYKEVRLARLAGEYGVNETFRMDGHVLLSIRLTVTPQWTEPIERFEIDDKNIRVVTDTGSEIPMIGSFEQLGMFRLENRSFSPYRPYDWKEKKESESHSAVFAVPETVKSVEYKCGPISKKIQIPSVTEAPNPASVVKFQIASAKLLDKVETSHRAGDIEPSPKAMLANPNGKILELRVKITPTMGNGNDPNSFFWKTEWAALKVDGVGFVRVLGQWFMDKVDNGVSNNLSASSGTFNTDEKVLYFAVPEGAKSFTLLYLNQPMAQGQV